MTSTKYPTDLTDAQWDKLLPYLPEPSPIGRPLKWEMRSIINAIFYIVKSGCQYAASSNATVANGLFPLQKVENFRYMGYDSSSTSRANPL